MTNFDLILRFIHSSSFMWASVLYAKCETRMPDQKIQKQKDRCVIMPFLEAGTQAGCGVDDWLVPNFKNQQDEQLLIGSLARRYVCAFY